MASILTPLAASLLPLSLAWAALGMPVNGNGTGAQEEQTAPLRPHCQLRIDDDGESIVLEGVVFARRSASGSYDLRVSQESAGGKWRLHRQIRLDRFARHRLALERHYPLCRKADCAVGRWCCRLCRRGTEASKGEAL
jgi:hypothetical protein